MSDKTKDTIKYLDALTKSIHGWSTLDELEFLYQTAGSVEKRGVIVEIGSWQGRSTVCLAQGSRKGNNVKVYAIDPFTGSSENQKPGLKIWTLDDFKNNLSKAGIQDMVVTLVATSEEAARDWNKPIEFLFIDGAHEYEFVEKDFLFYSPYIINGGIIAFHDTAPNLKAVFSGLPSLGLPGPKKVVEKYIFKSRQFKNIGLIGSIIYATKCDNNSWIDRLRGKICQSEMFFNYLICDFYSQLKKLPKPIKHFLKHIL